MRKTNRPRPVASADDELSEILVEGRGPRFVAPTTRDKIGRIWAPTYIDGRGLSGPCWTRVPASLRSPRSWQDTWGYTPDKSEPMLMHGVTGSAVVPTVRVKSLAVGDLTLDGPALPIVPDALGGADGILGTAGLLDKRIQTDFRHDKTKITLSRGERPGPGFTTIPFTLLRGRLIVINVKVGNVRAKAIIDTGGEATLANFALHDALVPPPCPQKG